MYIYIDICIYIYIPEWCNIGVVTFPISIAIPEFNTIPYLANSNNSWLLGLVSPPTITTGYFSLDFSL